ncbi:MAG: class I SAM-dependent methyltransferase [Bacteroidota bacterium]
MPKIEIQTEINSTIDICFDLSRSIDLHKISTLKTNEEAIEGRRAGLINLNETVTWQATHFGIRQRLTSKITVFERPVLFIDEQIKGVFKSIYHEHKFKQLGNKVIMIDIFEFHSPFGIIGRIFNKLILTNYLRKLLINRNNVIKEFAETEKWKEVLNENNLYSPEYIKDLFNKMSSSYERMNYITSFGFSIRWRRKFLSSFNQTNHKAEIIDLLTGMGETWSATKNRLPNSNITVLDFSEGMLRYARQKNSVKFNNEIIILQQDILKNKLQSNHYDFVTCAFGLKTFNAEQLSVLATETKRILKVGGQFSYIEVSKPEYKILKLLYGFYLGKVIPILGKILLGNPEEYKMLWKYTNEFNNAKKATEIFSNAGLKTKFKSYFFGCATGFYGIKTN